MSESQTSAGVGGVPVGRAVEGPVEGPVDGFVVGAALGAGSVVAGAGAGAVGLVGAMWEIARIALPSVLTMVSYTAMQFIDGLMVSRIEPASAVYVPAQMNGAMAAFLPMSALMGLTGVVNTYVAQHLGAGRAREGAAYAWNALWLCVVWWVVLVGWSAAVPGVFAAVHTDGELVRLESGYAQILLWGGVLTMATRALGQYFYGLHRPGVVLGAALIGNGCNVVLNWALIYGNLGAPALGVIGAAVATVVATGIELAIPLAAFLSPGMRREMGTGGLAWRPSVRHVRDLLRLGWAPALMFGNEMACWTYFITVLVGSYGVEDNHAGSTALRYMHLSFMPAVGMSFAMTAVVGRWLGAGRPAEAARRAWLGLGLSVGYMGVCAGLFVVFREGAIGLFVPEGTDAGERARIVAIGSGVMVLGAVFQVFDAVGITLIGVLRGAGDTAVPGVVTVVLAWGLIIGGGHMMVWAAPGLGSLGPWGAATGYIVALGVFLGLRFVGGSWRGRRVVAGRAG